MHLIFRGISHRLYFTRQKRDISAGSGNRRTNVTRTVDLGRSDNYNCRYPRILPCLRYSAYSKLTLPLRQQLQYRQLDTFSCLPEIPRGKGIATSFGAIVGMCSFAFSQNVLWLRLLPIFLILFTWAIVFAASRIVSLSSLAAAVATPLSFYFSKHPLPTVIAAICLSVLTFIAHRDNIIRLIKKEEKKLKEEPNLNGNRN